MTKRIIPKVRFNGFDDEWQQKCLSEIFNISSGFTGDSSLNDGKYYLTRIETIADGDINIDKLGFSNIEPNEKFRLNKGDILYSNINSLKHMGKVALFKADKTVYHGINLLRLSCKPQYNAEFLFYQLNTEEKRDWARSHANQAVSQASINQTSLGKQKLSHPKLAEQSQIGSLFSTIDSLLSSYKDNLENYQSFKKSMLSKMFPKAGQTVPEIRLDGFEGEWEVKKLGDVTERVKGNDGRMDLPTLTISAANGWMNQEERFSQNIAGKEQKNYTLLRKGELSYNHGNSKLAKYGVVFELENYDEALVPRVYHSFKVNKQADSKFIETMFATKKTDRELAKLVSSGARMDGLLNINFDEFMGITITIPSVSEQNSIGIFFSKLDNLISSYQTKINELETLKKKLLQDMFI